ncbi:MAG: DMT family transporter [Rhodospirillales bacterium]|jgi:DME family drug/metabolite transporter|nr:hypothetical protein [Rhodospirillaceae bacterium]MDP6428307.1 DMT family transporter [Rhodospirillales bacterium]MDP6645564.1 DMT family transporter [Rhodospirillales bacterium]MDP6842791.1 DMT family transporter [Rhodospirillales bacterium]|tara:strand:+ start:95 stop:994 length:900 start_codon:yes stop_codon:yes gene_type:complete
MTQATKSGQGFGIAVALGAAVCFGLANTIAGVAYAGGSDPTSVSGSRFVLPILILAAFAYLRKIPLALPRREAAWALALGVITALYTLALLSAINLLPVGIAILVFYLFPILTAFIAAIMGWVPLGLRTAGAAVVALAGLTFALGVRIEDYDPWGISLSALGALGLAIVSAVSGRVIANSDPMRATFYMAVGALIPLLFVVFAAGGFNRPESQTGWLGLVFTNIFYAFAMIGYFVAIGRVGAPMTTTLSNLEPLVAITAAFLLLGQSLAPLQLAGAAVVVGALIFAAYPRRVAAEAASS